MYFYLYDSCLAEKKYTKTVDKIENRLTDLGIAGKNIRLTILKSVKEIVQESLEKDAQTIVVVGEDQSFAQLAVAAAELDSQVTLGFIPTNPNSNLAKIFGLPPDETSADIISARLIKKIDLGKINNQYFLFSAKFNNHNTVLYCNDSYQITPLSIKKIKIVNLDFLQVPKTDSNSELKEMVSNPYDGLLEILASRPFGFSLPFFKKKEKRDSLFYVEKIRVESKKDEIQVLIDQNKIIKTPVLIEVVPEKIRVIVGRERLI